MRDGRETCSRGNEPAPASARLFPTARVAKIEQTMGTPDRSHLKQILLAVLAAAGVHGILWQGSYEVFSSSVDFNQGALEDFMGVYLPATYNLATGPEPVAGFFYSPFFAWLLQPFTMLRPQAASWVWLGWELMASALLLVLGWRWVRGVSGGAQEWWLPLYVFLGALSFPLAHNLHWGQISTTLALLVVAAAGLQDRRLGAACIGLAAAIKFYPAVFFLLLFLGRDWRSLRWGLGTWAGLSILPGFQVGFESLVAFYEAVASRISEKSGLGGEWFTAPNNQSLPSAAARWLGLTGWGLQACAAIGWAAALFVLNACARLMGEGGVTARLLAFALLLLSLPLVLSPSWPHYFAALPFVQLLLARLAGTDRIALGSVAVSVLLSSCLLFRWMDDPVRYGRWGLLLIANLVLLPVALRTAKNIGRGQSD